MLRQVLVLNNGLPSARFCSRRMVCRGRVPSSPGSSARYRIDMVLTNTSRAANEAIRPMPIFQS